MSQAPRIVIVGAGPAGVRAAQALVEAGVRPILVDEGQRDGGQIYRRQPAGFRRSYAKIYGSEAAKAAALHSSFDALRERVDYRDRTLAWNVTANALHTTRDGTAVTLPFDALIVCAGATDRLMPLPGWQRAGCYSLGAAQIALKAQACAIGTRTVFLGSGPLLYLVATQYLRAGANVAAVLDTARAAGARAALAILRARPRLALRGLGMMWSLRRAGVPVLQGVRPLAIDGDTARGVSSVRVLRRARPRTVLRGRCGRARLASAARDAAGGSGALRVRLRAGKPPVVAAHRCRWSQQRQGNLSRGRWHAHPRRRRGGSRWPPGSARCNGRPGACVGCAGVRKRGRAAAPRAANHGPLPRRPRAGLSLAP